MRNIDFSEPGTNRADFDALQKLTESQAIAMTLRIAWIQSLQFPSNAVPSPMPELRPRSLLSLLTYAYARGIYASEEIERLCQTDVAMRFLCAGNIPTRQQLIGFRKLARLPLKASLGQVLEAASQCFDRSVSRVTQAPGMPLQSSRQTSSPAFPPASAWPPPPATCMSLTSTSRIDIHGGASSEPAPAPRFDLEADERIHNAIFADCMDSDD